VTQRAGAALTGAGSVVAAAITHPPQIKGGSTGWSVTEPMASLSGVAGTATSAAGVTQPKASSASAGKGPGSSTSSVTEPMTSSSSGVS
jgi:hypothetical protein